jgi:hypothetical protein
MRNWSKTWCGTGMAPLLMLLLTFEKKGPASFLPPSGSKSLLQKGD